MTPDLTQGVCFLIAGMVGATFKALVSQGQDFLSKKTIVDVCVGGFIGVLYPLYPALDNIIKFPTSGTLLQQSAFIAMISYVAGHIIMSGILNRVGTTKELLAPTAAPPKP